MRDTLPLRHYFDLDELQSDWKVTRAEFGQWLCEGILKAHTWLPLSSFYEVDQEVRGNQIIQTRSLCHREGYFELLTHDCQKLIHDGQADIREFADQSPGRRLALPDGVASKPIFANQLVILNEERQRFEGAFDLRKIREIESLPNLHSTPVANFDSGQTPLGYRFRKIHFEGEAYSFGVIQASVLAILYEAAQSGVPWVNGKQLLAKASSLSFSVSNLFKRKVDWRKFISSDGLGNYCLNSKVFQKLSTCGSEGPPRKGSFRILANKC